MGLDWSASFPLLVTELKHVPEVPGVYKLLDPQTDELLYIGESYSLFQRFGSHAIKPWTGSAPITAYVQLPVGTPSYQRHEIENDLVAGYYAQTASVPRFQLLNHK